MSGPSPASRVEDVVSVHVEAFPDFFMSQLGPAFLGEYYRCILAYPLGVLLTSSIDNRCSGFAAGFVNPAAFYRQLRRRRLRLGLAALGGIAAKPRRVVALLGNYRRAAHAAGESFEPRTAELSSLGVRPALSGRGVGAQLVREFVVEAGRMGAKQVMLTTDAADNDDVNTFYQRLGFMCVRTFEARRGRVLNQYLLHIGKAGA